MRPPNQLSRPQHGRTRGNRGGGGFTLIELLVVVAVITLLVALLLPALSRAKEAGRRAKCMANLRMFTAAALIYDNEFREMPTGKYNFPSCVLYAHTIMRNDYGVRSDTMYCPSSTGYPASWKRTNWDINNTDEGRTGYYYVGGNSNHPRFPKWNGWHVNQFPEGASGFFPPVTQTREYGFGETNWKPISPSKTFVIRDLAYWNYILNPPYVEMPQNPSHVNSVTGKADGGNTAFFDGHVEWHTLIPGKSWQVHTGQGDGGYWTPPFATPAGALLLLP